MSSTSDSHAHRLPCVHRVVEHVPDAVGPLRDTAITARQLEGLFRDAAGSGDDTVPRITFDDGYRSVHEIALPMAERHGVPIAAFVTTGFIDGTQRPIEDALAALVEARPRIRTLTGRTIATCKDAGPLSVYRQLVRGSRRLGRRAPGYVAALLHRNGVRWPDSPGEGFLDWAQVRELARHPLVTVGAHTLSHPNLKYVGPLGAWRELRDARIRLEHETGCIVNTVAYPYGRSWRWTRAVARRAGYNRGYGTEDGSVADAAGMSSDTMNIGRWNVHHDGFND